MFTTYIIPQLKDNYSYILRDDQYNITCVVDPSTSKTIIDFLNIKRWNLNYILNTHHHGDHIGGNNILREKYNAKIVASKYDQDNINYIDIEVEDNDYFLSRCQVVHIPGHTKGHIAFYFKEEESLYCGDTLFSLGCGRIFEGTPSQMYNSLQKITKLPLDTKIYPGHEYTLANAKFALSLEPNNNKLIEFIKIITKIRQNNDFTVPSTIDIELKFNPFLRCDDLNIKSALSLQNSNQLEIFTELRRRKDSF